MSADTDDERPIRPQHRGQGFYDGLKPNVRDARVGNELFSVTIHASRDEQGHAKERGISLQVAFHPLVPRVRLRMADRELLLSYLDELFRQISDERL